MLAELRYDADTALLPAGDSRSLLGTGSIQTLEGEQSLHQNFMKGCIWFECALDTPFEVKGMPYSYGCKQGVFVRFIQFA